MEAFSKRRKIRRTPLFDAPWITAENNGSISSAGKLGNKVSSQEITLNELQWKSAELAASAGKVVVAALRQPLSSMKHYRIRKAMDDVVQASGKFLAFIHSSKSIAALEGASTEERDALGQSLENACGRLHMLIAQTDAISRSGHWRERYAPKLEKIRDSNRQLKAHASALRSSDVPFMMLTRRDQEFLLESLLNPQEPSEEMRRVFTRR